MIDLMEVVQKLPGWWKITTATDQKGETFRVRLEFDKDGRLAGGESWGLTVDDTCLKLLTKLRKEGVLE